MKSINQISAKFKFHLLLTIILLFSLISALTFFHTINSISEYKDFENKFEQSFSKTYKIDHGLQRLAQDWSDTLKNYQAEENALIKDLEEFESDIKKFKTHYLIISDTAYNSLFIELSNSVNYLKEFLKNLPKDHLIETTQFSSFQVHQKFTDPILESEKNIREYVYKDSYIKQRRYHINLFIVLFFSIVIITLLIVVYTVQTTSSVNHIQKFVKTLESGGNPKKLNLISGIEFQNISNYLNNFLDHQDEKLQFLKTIGKGKETKQFSPQSSDLLGNEIKIMAERLEHVQITEKVRQAEEFKRSWTSEGIAEFAEILRSERENVQELSFKIIQKLVTYLKVEMGTIFLTSDETDKKSTLSSIASYAYDRRKYINKTFQFGEGLPGSCALEKEKIYINEVPNDYSEVISGVGQAKPNFILLVPLKIENEIFGILELGSFRGLEPYELKFVDQLAESIASTLLGVKTNERTAILLRQSQEQAEKLIQQEEKMLVSMRDLENAQKDFKKKEGEITGILNAMNKSSLVAEFSVNGKFTQINEKFLQLLESPEDMILGKHHNEFTTVDRYSEDYKAFWKSLQKGEIISKEEKLKLYSGKEIYLQQTYTPIRNNEGDVYKILNIAIDISNTKIQQDSLLKQAAEITRQNLEMESLNEAVNSSIIKCELDAKGVILNVNDNFESISGYMRKEMLGRNHRLFLRNIEKEQFDKIWAELMKKKTYEGAIRRTKPTGEEVWLMSTFSPVQDESGKIVKVYFLALDITEKRLKYSLLEDANHEIERLRILLKNYE